VVDAQDFSSRGAFRNKLTEFSVQWREKIDSWDSTQRGRSEVSHAQTFWSELLRCFDIIPERINLFERDAVRASTGRTGSIDVFQSGVFLGEAKSAGKDLDAAYEQALDYLRGGSIAQHEWPKFIIVTDFERVRVVQQAPDGFDITIPLDELADHVDQLIFLAGREVVTPQEEREASVDAARIMAKLYETMTGTSADDPVGEEAAEEPGQEDARVEQASVFLTRVLFLLYGDDAGLWREDLFYEFVLNYTRTDGSDLGQQLRALFDTLNTPEDQRSPHLPDMIARFPYVNGSLFNDYNPPEFFDAAMREALLDACRFKWTRISPAVFGSMFQLVKSKEARRTAGEHYTSEKNILKTVGPLFLDDLRAEADRLIRNKSTTLVALRQFRDSLATHVFADPACGCGNFLVVAYRELRRIETDIIVELRKREGEHGMSWDATLETKLTIGQFHGIEIHWWPAKIAETAMFLVDHHANRELAAAIGQAPDRLPITITAHIHHTNAMREDWATLIPTAVGITYVFGNPPFVGARRMTEAQKDDLREVWPPQDIANLDYVTGWHAKTLTFLADRKGDFAFVATNSISQGQAVPVLFRRIFDAGWRIKFAHRTFAWDSEAPGKAAVHCVIVGFTRDRTSKPRLYDYADVRSNPVEVTVKERINAYLADGPHVLVEARRDPLGNLPRVDFGSMANDDKNLLVSPTQYDDVQADEVAAAYLREFKGAKELVQGKQRWCLWMENLNPSDVARSPVLTQRIEATKQHRLASRRAATRGLAQTPHLFGERRQPTTEYLCIPRHGSEDRRYFPAARFGPDVIAGDANFTAPDADGLLFALLSSSMFLTWQLAVGGRIKNDPRFSGTLSWNTFPVPDLDDATKKRIIDAGKAVLAARALHPERSLADHYNPNAMDPELVKAHNALDREVDKAFGASKRLTTEAQRLELLFPHYVKLTSEAG